MAGGVSLTNITVNAVVGDEVELTVQLTVRVDDEFEAIGWLVSQLGKDL